MLRATPLRVHVAAGPLCCFQYCYRIQLLSRIYCRYSVPCFRLHRCYLASRFAQVREEQEDRASLVTSAGHTAASV
jgi:hypothetical protein